MSKFQLAFEEWTANVQLPGNITKGAAIDLIQTYAPTLTQTEGGEWWDAIAVEYESLDVEGMTVATYVGLRDYVDGNETNANDLFDALKARIRPLPESVVFIAKIEKKEKSDDLANIDDDIAELDAARDAAATEQLTEAYDVGSVWLANRKAFLELSG